MKVLVTGGAGFIGSHLVDLLCDEGHDVTVLDDLSTGCAANLSRRADEVELVEGTVLDGDTVDRLVGRSELVFHLAAAVGVHWIVERPLQSMVVNARGTEQVLESCHRHDRRVVLASTSEVYGKTARLPMCEDDDRVLGPPSASRWSYATAKALDEHLGLAYGALGLSVTVLRYFNAYGPRLDPRGYGSVVAGFLRQALAGEPLTVFGDGLQTRCFTYVTDTARGTLAAGFEDAASGQVINLGSSAELSVRALAELVIDRTGSSSTIELVPFEVAYGPRFEETRRRVPDTSRAAEILDWHPTVTLEEGLRRTLEAWEEAPESLLPARRRGPGASAAPANEPAPARPTVVVMGLGYVGLPLALAYASAGFPTIGFDVDSERVAHLNAGRSHIEDLAASEVAAAIERGCFEATDNPRDIGRGDCVFVCVPTPFDEAKTPDLSCIRSATHLIADVLRPGMLVVLQSTTFPGTTTEVVQPILEQTRLQAGIDFDLAFSPERVDPGNRTWTVRNTPKIVGGVTPAGARRAADLLTSVMDPSGSVRVVSTPAAAEMAKLLENTYRAVNIALVNELAMLAHEMDIDLWEVIDAASTKPFGFEAFLPGVGPGGHCIPVDPYYLAWKARSFEFQTKFIELAADTNLRMAVYVRTRVMSFLNKLGLSMVGSRILAVGASFKPGVGDIRNSRALRLLELLEDAGAEVAYSDPHVPTAWVNGRQRKSIDLTPEAVARFDLAVVLVAHPDVDLEPVVTSEVPVFDATNRVGAARSNLERL